VSSCISHGIGNVGFGIRGKKDKYKLSFFVNNVTDKHYANTGYTGLGAWSACAPNPAFTFTTTIWTPYRVAFRYVGVRFDMTY